MPLNEENADPDLAQPGAPASTPPERRFRSQQLGRLGIIVAGGALGTLVRAALEAAVPAGPGGWPWATFTINISGAFLLGFLLEALARTGPDSGWRRQLRLTAGTGFLGGYTTYSTFAVEISQLTLAPPHLTGPVYAVVSVLLGPAAAAAGYMAARRIQPTPSQGSMS